MREHQLGETYIYDIAERMMRERDTNMPRLEEIYDVELIDTELDKAVMKRLKRPFGCEHIQGREGPGHWRIHDANDDAIAVVAGLEKGYAELIVNALNTFMQPPLDSNATFGGIGAKIFKAIFEERKRQEELKAQGRFQLSCADTGISHMENYSVLGEEVGEVGHVLNESLGSNGVFDLLKLQTELIQVAAVAVAWLEKVDRDIEGHRRICHELIDEANRPDRT